MAPPTRTQRILEWGEHRRGVWRPEEGSLTLRAYRWWAKSSGKAPAQENFCHFWRVALIWAPLRWLTMPLRWLARLLRNPKIQLGFAMGAMLALVTAAIASTSGVFVAITMVVACLAAAAYVAAGSGLGLDWLHRRDGYPSFVPVQALREKSLGAYRCLWVATAPVAWGLIAVLVALWVACEGTSRLSWWIFGYRIRGWRFVRPFTVMLAAGFLYLVASAWWVEASRTVLLAILIVGAGCLAMLAAATGLAVAFVSVEAGVREWKERRPRPGVSLEKKAPSRRRASPLRRALEPFALVWAALRAWKMGICPIVEIPRSSSD